MFCGDLSDSGRKEKECRKLGRKAEWLREVGAGWMWRALGTPPSCKLYTDVTTLPEKDKISSQSLQREAQGGQVSEEGNGIV